MSDLIISYIRTYVPKLVAVAVSWVAIHWGIVVPESISGELAVLLTGAVFAVYYGVVRALEARWPWFGKLLGRKAAPVYGTDPPESAQMLGARRYGGVR